MRTVGIITARGGSKGIPRKNLKLLAGKPLLVWTVEAALQATKLARVILSTDDDEIADIGRTAGIDVPFMRPRELALDTTPSLPVLQHAANWLDDAHDPYQAIVLLQPTSPLRTAATIDGCVALLERSGADSVMTVIPIPAEHNPHWVYVRDASGALTLVTGEKEPIARRQDLPPAFCRDGSVFVVRREVLVERSSLYGDRTVGYVVNPASTVDIDTEEDWARTEAVLRDLRR
jgi:CMP-N-acetylneuraminic acid synthetase